MKKTWDSLWLGILPHLLKANTRWYERGRTGEGRIVMNDQELQGARVRGLRGARFERCDFSGANLCLMQHSEMIDCTFDELETGFSTWEFAQLIRCRFRGAWLGSVSYDHAQIEGCDWLGAFMTASSWSGAVVSSSRFRGAAMFDSRFDGGTFVDCDFRYSILGRRWNDDLASASNAVFRNCDFLGADLDRLRLDNVTFEGCIFDEIKGKPKVAGPVTIIDPRTSRRDNTPPTAKELLKSWR